MNELSLSTSNVKPAPKGSRHDIDLPQEVYNKMKELGVVMRYDPAVHPAKAVEAEAHRPAHKRVSAPAIITRSKSGIWLPTLICEENQLATSGESPKQRVHVRSLDSFLERVYDEGACPTEEIQATPQSESSGTISVSLKAGTQGTSTVAGTPAYGRARVVAVRFTNTHTNGAPAAGAGALSMAWVHAGKTEGQVVLTKNGTGLDGEMPLVAGTPITSDITFVNDGMLFIVIHETATRSGNPDRTAEALLRSSGLAFGSKTEVPQADIDLTITATSGSGLGAQPFVVNASSHFRLWQQFESAAYRFAQQH